MVHSYEATLIYVSANQLDVLDLPDWPIRLRIILEKVAVMVVNV